MKSLHRRGVEIAKAEAQMRALNDHSAVLKNLPKFKDRLGASQLWPLNAIGIDTLQVNLGKLCNQVCKHCHVDAGPDRTEIMTQETMEQCLSALRSTDITSVDITGGAPEMNPHFRWFVEEISKLGRKTTVRCNLTIILAGKAYEDLPEFFAKHQVQVVSSLPYYEKQNTDRQRGLGVFDKSIRALQLLNQVGYGRPGSGLQLDLVYNPGGAFLPASEKALESDFKRELKKLFDIEFNRLFAITNLPVSRFLDYLIESGNLDQYMEKLVNAFNPSAAQGVMCRSLISVSWDGFIYDCDFNQMLEIPVTASAPQHIRDFTAAGLSRREIQVNQHCFGCTAGQGSSCGGQVA